MTAADGTKIAEDLQALYAAAASWRHERGSEPLFGSGTVEVLIERTSRAEERERVLTEALGRTVWRERSQFPGNPFCVICGAGKKWTTIHGHESTCPLAAPAQPQTGGSK